MANIPLSSERDYRRGGSSPGSTGGLYSAGLGRDVSERRAQEQKNGLLAKVVEGEIIPRLMLAHRQPPAPVRSERAMGEPSPLGPETTEIFARLVLSKDVDALLAYVGSLIRGGAPLDAVYVDLFAPAARLLNDYWANDAISFVDVTIGLGRLQQILRALSLEAPHLSHDDGVERAAFFAPCPGEQHTFGLLILEDFFRRSGWRTSIEPSATKQGIGDAVRGQWFDLVGLSASNDSQLDQISATIVYARRASRNRDITIMVGGRLFAEHPEFVSAVGADATAAGPADALEMAENAVGQTGRHY